MADKNQPTGLSHVSADGRPQMVDVSAKDTTRRDAHARATVVLPAAVAAQFVDGDLVTKKGPVLHTAVIAGTMAVKRTDQLIPFCHPLAIERCDFTTDLTDAGELHIHCAVGVTGKTGVEMEALTGATVAALTVYDMLKALSHDLVIANVQLLTKTGGKSDINRQGQA